MASVNGTSVSFCNQPKAHFGLSWVRPWDNHGKCHMHEKKIQCFSNVSQHVPIYLQPFPSNSSSKVRHFSLPWIHPWDNRGKCYMDGKRIQCWSNASQHVPSIFKRLRAIERYWSEIATFSYPLAFNALIWGVPIGIPGKSLVLRKLESCGYQAVKTIMMIG